MKQKILSCLLITAVMLFYSSFAYADEASDLRSQASEKFVNELIGLQLPQEATVTRADFIKLVTKMLKTEIPQTAPMTYFDVEADDELNAVLYAATQKGLISGGAFRPNDSITYAEAVTIATRAAGYELFAQLSGGYPNGYFKAADTAGITDKVPQDVYISREASYILFENMMLCDMYEYDGNGFSPNEGSTLLKNLYNMRRYTGVMTANDITGLGIGAVKTAPGQIKVDNYEFFVEDENLSTGDYIGRKIKVFYDEDDFTAKIIAPFENKTVSFSDADIELNSDYLKVIDDEGNTEDYELADGYSVIYNGKNLEEINEAMFNPDSGTVSFVDNDKDDEYEIIYIESFEYFEVGKVNTINMTIPDKNNGSHNIDLSDSRCIYEIYDPYAEQGINIVDVLEGTYIGVKKSLDGLYVYIELCEMTINGKITAVNDDIVTINDVEYSYANNFKRFFTTSPIGMTGVFTIGKYGEIIGFSSTETGWVYAYLYKAFKSESGDEIIVKFFDEKGIWNTLTLAERIVIDGVSGKYSKNIDSTLLTLNDNAGQIVKCYLYEGELKKIDLPEGYTKYGESNQKQDDNSLTRFDFNASNEYYYSSYAGIFYPNFSVRSSKVFVLPADKARMDKYRIDSKSVFAESGNRVVIPYDVDKTGEAKVILYDNSSGTSSIATQGSAMQHVIVEKVSSVYDEEDDAIKTQISGWMSGKFVRYILEEDVTVTKATGKNEIVPGDLLKCHVVNASTVDWLVVDFDYAAFASNSGVDNITGFNENHTWKIQLYGGMVYSIGNQTMAIIPQGKSVDPENISVAYVPTKNIVVFNKQLKTLRPGELEDIKTYLEYGDSASFVIIRTTDLVGNQIVVYEE